MINFMVRLELLENRMGNCMPWKALNLLMN